MQARAAMLPSVNYSTSFIYTQPNGKDSGPSSRNNGAHEYISQGIAHQAFGFASLPDYRRAQAALALARARAEIAVARIGGDSGAGVLRSARRPRKSDRHVAGLPTKRSISSTSARSWKQGGEVAHSDVIKAQIQANDLQRASAGDEAGGKRARLAWRSWCFPTFFRISRS